MADDQFQNLDICGAPLKCLDLQKSSVSLQGKGAKLLEDMKAAAAFLTAHKPTEDVRRLGVGGLSFLL